MDKASYRVLLCYEISGEEAERFVFFFQAEDGIRDYKVTGVQTCALPISDPGRRVGAGGIRAARRALLGPRGVARRRRSEEHTSELQSPCNLVCRLLLEKKKKIESSPIQLSLSQRSGNANLSKFSAA